MNDDNKMDDLIRAAAASYNVPPSVPREEMWAGIEAARPDRAADPVTSPKLYVVPATVASAAGVSRPRNVSRGTSSKTQRFAWWNMAAAAAVLIATGVGIGRWTTTRVGDREDQPAPSVASAIVAPPAIVSSVDRSVGDASEPQSSSFPVEAGEAEGSGAPRSSMPVRALSRASRGGRVASASGLPADAPGVRRNSARPGTVPPGSQSALPYQVATIRHLTDAEALLTSFNLESREQRTDSRLAGWAKGLLSNTRLLLDSPAGDDPRRAELLEDLELVLAQIVQLSPGAAAQERDLINGSIRNGAMMTRLRTAIPAGPTRGF